MSASHPSAAALRDGGLFFLEKPPHLRAVVDDESYLDNLLEVCRMSRSHLKPGPITHVTRARPEGTDFPFTPWANDLLKSLDPTVARKVVAFRLRVTFEDGYLVERYVFYMYKQEPA